MTQTDAELVQAALAGSPQAFEELIKRYQKLVFNIVYHYLGRANAVEDVAQEVFLRLYKNLPRYDPAKSLKPWVSRITTNCCLDELRKTGKQRVRLLDDLKREESESLEDIHNRFQQGCVVTERDAETLFSILQKQLDRVADKDRMAFVLRELEGLDYSGIAQALGSSQLAARIRVCRVKKQLREELEGFELVLGG